MQSPPRTKSPPREIPTGIHGSKKCFLNFRANFTAAKSVFRKSERHSRQKNRATSPDRNELALHDALIAPQHFCHRQEPPLGRVVQPVQHLHRRRRRHRRSGNRRNNQRSRSPRPRSRQMNRCHHHHRSLHVGLRLPHRSRVSPHHHHHQHRQSHVGLRLLRRRTHFRHNPSIYHHPFLRLPQHRLRYHYRIPNARQFDRRRRVELDASAPECPGCCSVPHTSTNLKPQSEEGKGPAMQAACCSGL